MTNLTICHSNRHIMTIQFVAYDATSVTTIIGITEVAMQARFSCVQGIHMHRILQSDDGYLNTTICVNAAHDNCAMYVLSAPIYVCDIS